MSRIPPALLFLFAFALRLTRWHLVFGRDPVLFIGADAYYHVRRILYSLANPLSALEFDRYLNFPDGGRIIWPPLFDLATATLLFPVHRLGGSDLCEPALALVPPLLGAAGVVALYGLARHLFDRTVAIVSGVLLGLAPGHYHYSSVGSLDHHPAVDLLATLLLLATCHLIALGRRPSVPPSRLLASSGGVGALAAASLLLWPGSILHVAVVEVALWVFLVTRSGVGDARSIARCFTAMNAVALAAVLPFSAGNEWPRWSPYSSVVLSNFQPWALGTGLLSGLGALLVLRFEALGSARWRRAVGFGSTVLGLLALSWLAFPELRTGLWDAWQWMGREDSFLASVVESRPLFFAEGSFGLEAAELLLSRLVYLFPLAWIAWVADAWTRREQVCRPELLLVAGWSLVLFAVTSMQLRFVGSFSIAMCLTIGWALVVGSRGLLASGASRVRRAAVGFVVLAVLFLGAPTLARHAQALLQEIQALEGSPPELPWRSEQTLRYGEMGQWIDRHTPPVRGWLDASQQPGYGVLARWDVGHVLTLRSRRPTAHGNFGDHLGRENFEAAEDFFRAETEEQMVSILDELEIRYLVLDPVRSAAPAASQLYHRNGIAFSRFRLIHEGEPLSYAGGARLRLFEYVRAARVVGTTAPHASVLATLELGLADGQTARWGTLAEADSRGRYALRLPYATRGASSSIGVAREYRLRSRERTESLAVSEAAVLEGLEIPGPRFE